MPSYARKHQLQNSLIYHVYNRSHRGQFVFQKKEDFQYFLFLLARLKQQYHVKIYHWVIMSNHYHLCLELDNPQQISGCLSGMQRAYTHYFNTSHKLSGYLWQSRFKSQPIESDRYLMACGRYIERNPVRAKMVAGALEYPYSSAQYYCLGIHDGITDGAGFYEGLADRPQRRQKLYREFLQDFNENEEELFRPRPGMGPVGSEKFKARLIKSGKHYLPRREGRPREPREKEEFVHK